MIASSGRTDKLSNAVSIKLPRLWPSSSLLQLEGSERLVYLKEISHALKSSAASFGADSLCELAMSIDKKAKSGELVEQGCEVNTMLDRLNETRDAYRSWTQ